MLRASKHKRKGLRSPFECLRVTAFARVDILQASLRAERGNPRYTGRLCMFLCKLGIATSLRSSQGRGGRALGIETDTGHVANAHVV
jgi:hypothetical protein